MRGGSWGRRGPGLTGGCEKWVTAIVISFYSVETFGNFNLFGLGLAQFLGGGTNPPPERDPTRVTVGFKFT